MKPQIGVIEKGRSVRDMHHLRLMALLQELERDNGRKKTAEILGVDRRTLDSSLNEGVLSRRIRNQLQKALQSGVGSAAAEQRNRNDKLEDRIADLEEDTRGELKEMSKELRALRDAYSRQLQRVEQRLSVLESGFDSLETRVVGFRMDGPDKVKESEWIDATPQLLAWRQALIALKGAEERLCKALAWETVPEHPKALGVNTGTSGPDGAGL